MNRRAAYIKSPSAAPPFPVHFGTKALGRIATASSVCQLARRVQSGTQKANRMRLSLLAILPAAAMRVPAVGAAAPEMGRAQQQPAPSKKAADTKKGQGST